MAHIFNESFINIFGEKISKNSENRNFKNGAPVRKYKKIRCVKGVKDYILTKKLGVPPSSAHKYDDFRYFNLFSSLGLQILFSKYTSLPSQDPFGFLRLKSSLIDLGIAETICSKQKRRL